MGRNRTVVRRSFLASLVMLILSAGVEAQTREVAFEFDGKAYDVNGTLIGPVEASPGRRLATLRSLIGSRGNVTRTNGHVARGVRLVRLQHGADGYLDSLVLWGNGWESIVAIDEISQINAAGRTVDFSSHPRRMYKLREVRLKGGRSELAARQAHLDEFEKSLKRDRSDIARRERDVVSSKRDLVTSKRGLEAEVRAVESRRIRLEDERRRLSELGEALTDRVARIEGREKELTTRDSGLRRIASSDRLSGKVTDEHRRPVTGAGVVIRHGGIVDFARTDAEGHFRMPATSSSHYRSENTTYRLEVEGRDITRFAEVRGKIWITVTRKSK